LLNCSGGIGREARHCRCRISPTQATSDYGTNLITSLACLIITDALPKPTV
jgi:hypothetical protein